MTYIKLLLCSFFIISNCSFQISIFNELNKKSNGKNFIVSPISIFHILSLTSNAANGLTKNEMLETLQSPNINSLNSLNYDFIKVFKSLVTVETANAVMARFEPEKEFAEICENYLAPTETLKSAQQVNNWCSLKTHGKITKLIDKLDPNTRFILLNAIYFKGFWAYKFIKASTRKKSFYNLNKNEIKVDMMNTVKSFKYYQDYDVQAVEIPYKNDNMSAIIILPNEKLDINSWISKVSNTKNNLYSIINKLSYKKVDLELPKFELDGQVTLNEYLENLGMTTAFSNFADFTKFKQNGNLKIDSVIHKTYLKVDEEGTEATATTTVVGGITSTGPIRFDFPYVMKVNRPFLFLIKNSLLPENYNLLFMAKIETLK